MRLCKCIMKSFKMRLYIIMQIKDQFNVEEFAPLIKQSENDFINTRKYFNLVDKLEINNQNQIVNNDKEFFRKQEFDEIAEKVYYLNKGIG